MRSPRRVVISGIGVVAPNGIGKDEFWRSLIAGKSGIRRITRFDASKFRCQAAGEIHGFRPADFAHTRLRSLSSMSRFSEMAVAAARLAFDDAKLPENPGPVGVCLGTSVQGNADVGESAHRRFLDEGWKALGSSASLEVAAHAAVSHVQSELRCSGPVMTVASACCTGVDTVGWGAEQIRNGTAKLMVVGAAEAPLSEFTYGLFSADGFLSTWSGAPAEASRPYDLHRSGLVLSEAAGALVIEEFEHAESRNAQIYGELLGYGSWSESLMTRDHYERYAEALQQAIAIAISRSGISHNDIDYVCAHGNSTKFDDKAEAAAHKGAFGAHAYRMSVSSIKSMVGQPFSAGAVLQIAAAALASTNDLVPPTINQQAADPDCDLDYVPNKARAARVNYALVHGHSLGGAVPGSHSAVVIGSARRLS
jgi:3-oxoacyl-[acyl-carrier-protein] synthase II